MYIWLVLTTFLAILAGYSLPMRYDAYQRTDVPIASAHMLKMVVNHRTALSYGKHNKWPFVCVGGAIDAGVKKYCDKENQIGFDAGAITTDMVSAYIPAGFEFNDDYQSYILCFNEDGTLSDSCQNEAGQIKK